jgi:diacylglycerol kinase (ATP)|tara:strand:+ start:3233 stop:3655 length:423 start_codon:yes stop_codon:yes gene_type:complete
MVERDPGESDHKDAVFDKAGNKGLRHLLNATRFSMRGLSAAFHNEAAFRQELALMLVLLPAAFFVGSNTLETAVLIAVSLMILIVELLNSGLEAIVDRIGTEHHPLSGRAKDLGSAAVMIALVTAFVIWTAMIYQNVLDP